LGLDGPVRFQEEDPDRALGHSVAVIVPVGPDRDIDHPVAVEISEVRDAPAKKVRIVQRPGEPAGGRADLLVSLDGPVTVQKEDPNGPLTGASIVVLRGRDRQILDGVPIEVAERLAIEPETIIRIQRPGEPS
jgi:hypothetical protein